jgi:hypothetical protein
MDPARATFTTSSTAVVFQDALGERRRVDGNGDPIELLHLRGELTEIPSFEFALRERASRLATFRHTYYGRVRSIDRLTDPEGTLAVASDHTRGVRLSTLLAETGPRPITIDINVALHFIRQIVSAVAFLHETARDVAHGAIGPERIIVTPNARAVIVEYVMGAALEQLRFSPDRYWRDLRIPLPASTGVVRFDHRADVTQIGAVALALILGRMLHDEESGTRLSDVVGSAWAISAKGGLEPLPAGLRAWLSRALQLDPRHSFASALDARTELDKVLAGEHKEERAAAAPAPAPRPAERPAERPATPVQEAAASEARVEAPKPQPVAVAPRPEPIAAVTHPEAPKPEPHRPAPVVHSVERVIEERADSSESLPDNFMTQATVSSRRMGPMAAAAVGLVVLACAGLLGARRYFSAAAPAAAAATGTLSISSSPAGVVVIVDGDSRGVTPLSIPLKPGPHNVELRGGGEPRTLPVTITAGTQVTQYIEMPAMPVAQLGQIQIRTEPAGAQVSVDGVPRGRSPLLVEGVAPGDHLVTLESSFGSVKQTVAVAAATTSSLVVPLTAAEGAPLSGWVAVSAPVDVQIFEGKQLLGTSQSDRIMVSAGRHDLEIVNDTLGYRSSRTVQVPPGKVAPIRIEWPKGTLAVNAVPWAEVWIDGERVGDTPMGNLSLPIGPHELVFRHPEFGELRHAAIVTANAPARVSVDMRKKP